MSNSVKGCVYKLDTDSANPSRAFDKCSQCGLCMSVCPTYQQERSETSGPRGRLALMRLIEREGEADVNPYYLQSCLRCGLCEGACPTGVPYPDLIRRHINQVAPRDTDAIWASLKMMRKPSPDTVRDLTFRLMAEAVAAQIYTPEASALRRDRRKVIFIAGATARVIAPDLVERAHLWLEEQGFQIVTRWEADALCLPWLENGLLQNARTLLKHVTAWWDDLSHCEVYVLDPSVRRGVSSRFLFGEFAPFANAMKECFDRIDLPAWPTKQIAIENSLAVHNIQLERLIGTPAEYHRVPERLRGAGGVPVVDASSAVFLDQLIRDKSAWLMEMGIDVLLTTDPNTLGRFPQAIHPIMWQFQSYTGG